MLRRLRLAFLNHKLQIINPPLKHSIRSLHIRFLNFIRNILFPHLCIKHPIYLINKLNIPLVVNPSAFLFPHQLLHFLFQIFKFR